MCYDIQSDYFTVIVNMFASTKNVEMLVKLLHFDIFYLFLKSENPYGKTYL